MSDALVPQVMRAFHGDVCPMCGRGAMLDALARARQTIEDVMDGRGGRNSAPRLRAAELVLGKRMLESLSNEDLIAELRRREDAAKAKT